MTAQNILYQYAISVVGQWLYRAINTGWLQFDVTSASAAWPQKLRKIIAQASSSMLPAPKIDDEWSGLDFDEFWKQLSTQNDSLAQKWISLRENFKLSPEEITLLVILVVIEYDLHILYALRLGMAESNPQQPRWGFMTRVLASDDTHAQECSVLLNPDKSILFKENILHLEYNQANNLATAQLVIDKNAADFLYDAKTDNEHFQQAVDAAFSNDDILRQVKPILEFKPPIRCVIHGIKGSGRVHLCKGLANALHYSGIWTVDLRMAPNYEQATVLIQNVRAMAALHHAMIVITAAPEPEERWREAMRLIACQIHQSALPVAWIFSGDTPQWLEIPPQAQLRLSVPNRSQREALWRAAVNNAISDKWIQQLSGQFILTKGQIEKAVLAAGGRELDEESHYQKLSNAARMFSKEGVGSLAVPEPARVSFDQLVVSSECETALKDLLMYARHRKELAKEWGFERSMAYGLGLSALFSGPPGTGKTFAAQVIATELKLELYRVDLSQIVSKYVGETEKHLAELFNAAEQGEILLLFDEADSIFGKRTEVKSSVDRYANLEINYLLQRLERFDGVSILTSNFDSAIDEAFMRRIRFKVPFDLPDERARCVLWNKFLSSAIPQADDVDLTFLAECFELSGGHIKEAVLRAASIAYGSHPKLVTQDLLILSAQLEYKKLGKLASVLDAEADDYSKWN